MGHTIGLLTLGRMVVVIGGLVSLVTAETVQAETVTLAAASSLRAPFQEILPLFEREYGVDVHVIYGPSQSLRQRIEDGAPIDLFLSEAGEVEKLHQKGLLHHGTPRIYAQSSPVLVMSTASQATSVSFHEGLPDRSIRIALVDPKTSALGDVTARALSTHPLLKNRSRLLRAPHSDGVANLVASGEADLGIVYRADAINSGQVRIIDEAPTGSPVPVLFGQAVVSSVRESSLRAAEQFLDYMMSPRIQKLLLKYGFDAIPAKGDVG